MDSLINFANNKKYSQNGEDGILDEIFKRINIDHGYFVEIGAGDGIKFSNTKLFYDKGWHGLLIEGDQKRFDQLIKNIINDTTKKHNGYVSCELGNKLDDVMDLYNVKSDFDLFSLDIDGNDYWVWNSLTRNPKVIVTEYNSNFPNSASLSIKYDPNHRFNHDDHYGATARAMYNLGKTKGYKLITVLGGNLFFVRNDLATIFDELPIGTIAECIVWGPSGKTMVKV